MVSVGLGGSPGNLFLISFFISLSLFLPSCLPLFSVFPMYGYFCVLTPVPLYVVEYFLERRILENKLSSLL